MINDTAVLANPLLEQIVNELLIVDDSIFVGIDSQLFYRDRFMDRFESDSNFVKISVLFVERVHLEDFGMYYSAQIVLGNDIGDFTIYDCYKSPNTGMHINQVKVKKKSYNLTTEYDYFILENYLYEEFYFPKLEGILDKDVNGVYSFGRFNRIMNTDIKKKIRIVYYKGYCSSGNIIGLGEGEESVNRRMIAKVLLDLDELMFIGQKPR